MAKDKDKKGFWKEFKEFISRGNILDMAVGVIVGGAFTAIITALTDQILQPIINWILAAIFGKDSLSEVFTFLRKVTLEDGTIDLAQSIYIDWGAFINAVINFLLIAFVLFTILKVLMRIQKARQEVKENIAESIEKRKAEEAQKQAELLATAEPVQELQSAEQVETAEPEKTEQ